MVDTGADSTPTVKTGTGTKAEATTLAAATYTAARVTIGTLPIPTTLILGTKIVSQATETSPRTVTGAAHIVDVGMARTEIAPAPTARGMTTVAAADTTAERDKEITATDTTTSAEVPPETESQTELEEAESRA